MSSDDEQDQDQDQERRKLRADLRQLKNSFRYNVDDDDDDSQRTSRTSFRCPLDRTLPSFDLLTKRFVMCLFLVLVLVFFFLFYALVQQQPTKKTLILATSKNIKFDL